jgi:hypothetical protein
MTTALLPITPWASRATADRAVSPDAKVLRDRMELEWGPSVVLGRRYWELERVRLEAATADWDGYGALPVDDLTYRQAKAFLHVLPINIPEPEVAADPDGEVSLSWRRTPNQVFSVSIGGTGRLSYAGLFGDRTVHGTEYFIDELPQPVEASLSRLFPAGI